MNAHYTHTPNTNPMTDRKSTIIALLMILGVFLILLITVKIASARPTLDTKTPRVSPLTSEAYTTGAITTAQKYIGTEPTPEAVSDFYLYRPYSSTDTVGLHTTLDGSSLQPAIKAGLQGISVPVLP